MATHETASNPPFILRRQVADLLAAHDAGAAIRFLEAYPPQENETIDQEIVRLNRFWRAQLHRLDLDTIQERDHLVDQCNCADWLRLFQRGVLATVLTHGLPR